MPIYEYLCPKCGHKTEIMKSITFEGRILCPRCHEGMNKIISLSTFSLKGSGWENYKPK